jgi:hypothetical protein
LCGGERENNPRDISSLTQIVSVAHVVIVTIPLANYFASALPRQPPAGMLLGIPSKI